MSIHRVEARRFLQRGSARAAVERLLQVPCRIQGTVASRATALKGLAMSQEREGEDVLEGLGLPSRNSYLYTV